MALDIRQGRHPGSIFRMVPDLRGLLVPGRRQIRLLRALQVLVRRQAVPQYEPHGGVPRRECFGRVPGGPGPVSARSDQGPHADNPPTICAQLAPGMEQDCGQGGHRWSV